MLAVPMIILEPVKFAALWWIASGRIAAGVAVLAIAKVAGMAVILRLHAIAKPKRMSIVWYRRIHDGVLGWRRRVYLSLMARAGLRHIVRFSKKYMHDLRARIVELRACLARHSR